MGLLELTEPFFQYICTLKKLSNSNECIDTTRIRQDLNKIFNDMQQNSGSSSLLLSQYDKIKLPLIFFADYVVYESNLNLSEPWNALASQFKELAGEEKFFVILEQELVDKSADATERLAIYYTCLGLGLKNAYLGDREELSRMMSRVFLRVSEKFKLDKDSRITPVAYENIDTRDFTEQLCTKLAGIGIVLAGLVILWAVCCICLYKWASVGISDDVKKIKEVEVKRVYHAE